MIDNIINWTRLMILQAYMALGGIPYYLSMLDNRQSLPQNLDRLFFKRDAELRKEYRRLFATLFKKPEPYMQIVQLLAESKKGLNRGQLAVFQSQTGTRCALWPTFITTFGLADGMYAQSIPAQVVLDDLFDN